MLIFKVYIKSFITPHKSNRELYVNLILIFKQQKKIFISDIKKTTTN
mgnify:FL=1